MRAYNADTERELSAIKNFENGEQGFSFQMGGKTVGMFLEPRERMQIAQDFLGGLPALEMSNASDRLLRLCRLIIAAQGTEDAS
jgi:hypothetical protein